CRRPRRSPRPPGRTGTVARRDPQGIRTHTHWCPRLRERRCNRCRGSRGGRSGSWLPPPAEVRLTLVAERRLRLLHEAVLEEQPAAECGHPSVQGVERCAGRVLLAEFKVDRRGTGGLVRVPLQH